MIDPNPGILKGPLFFGSKLLAEDDMRELFIEAKLVYAALVKGNHLPISTPFTNKLIVPDCEFSIFLVGSSMRVNPIPLIIFSAKESPASKLACAFSPILRNSVRLSSDAINVVVPSFARI